QLAEIALQHQRQSPLAVERLALIVQPLLMHLQAISLDTKCLGLAVDRVRVLTEHLDQREHDEEQDEEPEAECGHGDTKGNDHGATSRAASACARNPGSGPWRSAYGRHCAAPDPPAASRRCRPATPETPGVAW